VLAVNVASSPADAAEQFQQINALATSYPKEAFEVVGFWTADLHEAGEPESSAEFRKMLKAKLPSDFKLGFVIADKVKVNGPRQHAVYRWLKPQCGSEDIAGDFTKFLTTKQGRVHMRYEPSVPIATIKADIDAVLAKEEM